MKLILATIVLIGSCILYITAQEDGSSTIDPQSVDTGLINAGRFFFNFNSDPCTNFIYRALNISDAKCSLQCYIQGGLQQGGYCDDSNVCQCNQIN